MYNETKHEIEDETRGSIKNVCFMKPLQLSDNAKFYSSM